MANFDKLAATAQRLIEKNGRTVTLVQLDQGSDDPTRPWRGKTAPRQTPNDSVEAIAVFVPLASSIFLGIGRTAGDISRGFSGAGTPDDKRENQVAIVAADSVGDRDLLAFDEIVEADGSRWKIVQAQLLQPGDRSIMFAFEVKR